MSGHGWPFRIFLSTICHWEWWKHELDLLRWTILPYVWRALNMHVVTLPLRKFRQEKYWKRLKFFLSLSKVTFTVNFMLFFKPPLLLDYSNHLLMVLDSACPSSVYSALKWCSAQHPPVASCPTWREVNPLISSLTCSSSNSWVLEPTSQQRSVPLWPPLSGPLHMQAPIQI